MKPASLSALIAAAAAMFAGFGDALAMTTELHWRKLPDLPPPPGEGRQPGLAGAFAGSDGGALIVAGGANFPDRAPWDGGTKAWRDDGFVLERMPGGAFQWASDGHFRLPHPMGYGFSFSTSEGVVCAGGCDGNRCFSEVFLLRWDALRRRVAMTAYPSLPAPLSMMAGAQVGGVLYLAGGQESVQKPRPTRHFWALDLSKRGKPGAFAWRELPSWPGPGRIVPVAAGLAEGPLARIYLFSGRIQEDGGPSTLLTDAYVFDASAQTWKTLRDINGTRSDGGDGTCIMAGTAATAGGREIIILSGDRGDLFKKLEALDLEAAALRRQIASAPVPERGPLEARLAASVRERKDLSDRHPGFGHEVLAYEAATDSWHRLPDCPFPSQVTTLAVPWDGTWVIPNGEIRPGIRTPNVIWVSPDGVGLP